MKFKEEQNLFQIQIQHILKLQLKFLILIIIWESSFLMLSVIFELSLKFSFFQPTKNCYMFATLSQVFFRKKYFFQNKLKISFLMNYDFDLYVHTLVVIDTFYFSLLPMYLYILKKYQILGEKKIQISKFVKKNHPKCTIF